jgi:hypothetical protein
MPFYDFQSMPIGTVLETGEIQTCPHCGKPGLKEQVNGMDFYTHAMGWRPETIEIHHSILEMCPKPQPRPAHTGQYSDIETHALHRSH